MLHQAMANRTDCGFLHFLLSDVASIAWNPAIQAESIVSLDDSDPEVAASGAQVLAIPGGPEVEAPLWKRLEKWSERWRGRAAELAGHGDPFHFDDLPTSSKWRSFEMADPGPIVRRHNCDGKRAQCRMTDEDCPASAHSGGSAVQLRRILSS